MEEDQIQVDKAVRVIFDAMADSRRWEAVLGHLRQQLDAKGVALAEFDLDSEGGDIVHYVGYDSSLVRHYKEQYATRNVWLRQGSPCLPGQVSVGEEIIPAEELVATDFYRNWLEPQDFFHRLCGIIYRDGARMVYLEALRGRAQAAYGPIERRFVEALLPYFQRALQSSRHLWRLAIGLDILDNSPSAVLAVDSDRKVLFANQSAQEQLQDGKGLELRSGKLFASARNIDNQLKALIVRAAMAPRDKGNGAGGALVLRRGGHLSPLWLVVSPLSRPLRRIVGQDSKVALVFISTPDRINEAQAATLKTYYRLTPAEQKLTQLIFEGCRLVEAAERLGISINTARTHMKRIYMKTKTERQSDLVRVLLTGPVDQFDSVV